MSQHKPQLLGAVRAYINGTHSAQPAGQLITGQAERLGLVRVCMCVYMLQGRVQSGLGWARVSFLKDTPSLQQTWSSS